MAIIKYVLVNGRRPSGITQGGYWQHPSDETFIGVGSGVGIVDMRHVEWDNEVPALASPEPTVNRPITDAEIELGVDAWCTEMGIS